MTQASGINEGHWQRCRISLDAIALAPQEAPMQQRIEELRAMLPALQSQQLPPKAERRRMAKFFGVAQMLDGQMVDATTLVENIRHAFVECVRERRCSLESELPASSRGEHPAIRQVLQEVIELGRLPLERKKCNTEAEEAENKLRHKLRWHKLLDRAQQELHARRKSQSPHSGGSHPAANTQSAASVTCFRKRLRRKTTVPHYGVHFAPTPSATSEAAEPTHKGIKRTIDDPDGLPHQSKPCGGPRPVGETGHASCMAKPVESDGDTGVPQPAGRAKAVTQSVKASSSNAHRAACLWKMAMESLQHGKKLSYPSDSPTS